MYFFGTSVSRTVAIAICCTLLASCTTTTTESKSIQCTKLLQVLSQGNTLVDSKKESRNPASTQKLVRDVNQIAQQLNALPLTDPTLVASQKQLVQAFQQLSQAFGEIGKTLSTSQKTAASKEGREQIRRAKAAVTKAGVAANQAAQRQDRLTDTLLDYCNRNQ